MLSVVPKGVAVATKSYEILGLVSTAFAPGFDVMDCQRHAVTETATASVSISRQSAVAGTFKAGHTGSLGARTDRTCHRPTKLLTLCTEVPLQGPVEDPQTAVGAQRLKVGAARRPKTLVVTRENKVRKEHQSNALTPA